MMITKRITHVTLLSACLMVLTAVGLLGISVSAFSSGNDSGTIIHESAKILRYEDGSPYIHDVLTNHTDQTIIETQYGMLAFDADGAPLELYWNFLDSSAEQSFKNLVRSKENILPGQTEEYRGGWSLYDGESDQAAYALVCLKQVVFEDGTVWDNPDYESWLLSYAGKETDAEELEAYYPHEYKRL